MSDPLKDWENLQSQWQAYQPDIQQIKKKINWMTWRMGAILAFDVLVVLAYIPYLIYLAIWDDKGWLTNSWFFSMGIFLLYGVYFDFKIRLPIFRSQGESAREVLEFYLRRVKTGVTIGRVSKNFSWILLVLFVVWWLANYLFGNDPKIARWQVGLFGVCWVSLFIYLCHWYQVRKEKELVKLSALWKEYLE